MFTKHLGGEHVPVTPRGEQAPALRFSFQGRLRQGTLRPGPAEDGTSSLAVDNYEKNYYNTDLESNYGISRSELFIVLTRIN